MLRTLAATLPSGSRLLGLGAAQPEHAMTGEQLGAPFGKTAEWIRSRTGIRALHRLGVGSNVTDLAERAARTAVAAAGIDASSIDLVITASCSTTSDLDAAARRAAPLAGQFRLNAACSGFCYALQSADSRIRTGVAAHVLVLAAEHMSRMLDPDDLGTSIIFGDGAGAAVLGPSDDGPRIGPTVTGSDGSRRRLIEIRGGHLEMAGPEVFRWAVEHVPVIARQACNHAGVSLDDIDVFGPHQANLRIIDAVARALGLTEVVIADDIATAGNTSAASIPIALTKLLADGRARTGDTALLAGFGAGLSYAAQVVVLP